MADLMQLLKSQVSDSLLDQLSQSVGGKKENTSSAVENAMGLLMGALAKNSSDNEGASALSVALDRDHDGSILDDVAGLFSGNRTPSNQRAANGTGILKHILGSRKSSAVDLLSQRSGVDKNQASDILAKIAPVVMGMLGKVKKEQSLDTGGLSALLSGTQRKVKESNPAADIFKSLLDKDGDGSIIDDIAQSGLGNVLGNILGKK